MNCLGSLVTAEAVPALRRLISFVTGLDRIPGNQVKRKYITPGARTFQAELLVKDKRDGYHGSGRMVSPVEMSGKMPDSIHPGTAISPCY